VPKKKTSFTMSDEAMRLLKRLAEKLGVSMSATLEIIIREKAEKQPTHETP